MKMTCQFCGADFPSLKAKSIHLATCSTEIDRRHLSMPEHWERDLFLQRQCRVKSIGGETLSAKRFGVIYAAEPLVVYENLTLAETRRQEFFSLDELLKVWMVD